MALRVLAIATGICVVWIGAAFALDRHGRGREASGKWDAIVVAGARVRHDGTATGSLDRRTRRAIELWRAGHAPILVFTGGPRAHGRVPAEARVAADIARRSGVPETAIRLEERSTTTAENARFARELVGDRRVLVVTDAYHVFRAERLFRRYFTEVQVVGVAPSWHPQLRLAMREALAVGWYVVSSPFLKE